MTLAKNPLQLVLVGQVVVLLAAIGFLVGHSTSHPPAARVAHAPQPEHEPETEHEVVPLPRPEAHELHEARRKPEGHAALEAPPMPAPANDPGKLQEEPASDASEWSGFAPTAPAAKHAEAEAPTRTFEEVVGELVAGNGRAVEGVTRSRDLLALRRSLAAKESAEVAVVTCTDARLVPELLFDAPPGTFSVVRLSAAQPDDAAVKAVDDAVKRLGVKAVLVLGHFGCHHVEEALAKKGSRQGFGTALGPARQLEGDARLEAATVASVTYAANELKRRSRALGRQVQVPVLRVVWSPESGAVRWLDGEEAPPAPAPRSARR